MELIEARACMGGGSRVVMYACFGGMMAWWHGGVEGLRLPPVDDYAIHCY